MERGSPAASAATSDSRVSSPSAANTAACWRRRAAPPSMPARDMAGDVLQLLGPAAVVHAQRIAVAVWRQLVEAGLDDRETRAAGDLLEVEFHQRRNLLRVIGLRIDGVGMPGEAEQPLALHALHHHLHAQVLVARVGDLSGGRLPGVEGLLHPDAELAAELLVVGQCAPYPRGRGLQFDALLDSILHIGNLLVAG